VYKYAHYKTSTEVVAHSVYEQVAMNVFSPVSSAKVRSCDVVQ